MNDSGSEQQGRIRIMEMPNTRWRHSTKCSTAFYCLLQTVLVIAHGMAYDTSGRYIKIGGLFSGEPFDEAGLPAFKFAVDYVNKRKDILPNVTLTYSAPQSSAVGTFETIKKACSLVQEGPVAVIGPATTADVKAVSPIFAGLHIPHVSPFATDPTLSEYDEQYPYLFKMSAPDNFQSAAILDLINHFGWTRLGIIASATDYGRNGMAVLQSAALTRGWVITAVMYFQPSCNMTTEPLREILDVIKTKGTRVIVLNCQAVYARVVLDVAFELGMLTKGWAWITTDAITSVDSLYDQCGEVPLHLQGLLGIRPGYTSGLLYDDVSRAWMNASDSSLDAVWSTKATPVDCTSSASDNTPSGTAVPESRPFCQPNTLNRYAVAVVDAVLATAYGIQDLLSDGHVITPPSFDQMTCTSGDQNHWIQGHLLAEYISQVRGNGVSHYINFTRLRYPGIADYEVVNLRNDGWKQIGFWSSEESGSRLNIKDTAFFSGLTGVVPVDTHLDLTDVKLRVVTIIEAPFTMIKEDPVSSGETQYEGFCIDLLNRLQEVLGFQYELYLVPDGNYGGKDLETEEWNGMVGELIKDNADLAVAPLTINYERNQVIDFTKPFQDLGNIFVMAKESPRQTQFAFLDPFSTNLWLALGCAFIIFGLATTLVSWLSPFGKRGAYSSSLERVREKYKRERGAFNLWNSLWHTFSLWMMQGAEVTPTCLSGRLVYGAWYFIVMVISATYTANLAAFLTVKRLDSGITNLQDLANQRDIKYGTVKDTAIAQFFKVQVTEPYTTMYQFMEQRSTNVPNSTVGLQKVADSYGKPLSERYAFIFDSVPLEYAANQPPCHMETVGRLFNQFGYGLALQKNSPYVELFSLEILKLRQSGFLNTLYVKWVLSGTCKADAEASSGNGVAQQANLTQMMGVFLLMGGIQGFGLVVIFFEYCMAARNDTLKDPSLSFCEALLRRCRLVGRDIRENIGTCICCQSDREARIQQEETVEDHVTTTTTTKSIDSISTEHADDVMPEIHVIERSKHTNGYNTSRL